MAQFTFESPEYTAPSQQEFFWGIGAEVEFQNSRRTWGAFAQIMYAPVSTKSSRTRDYSEFNDMLVRSDFAADLNNLHVRVGPRYYFSSESRVRFYADASFGVVLPSGTMSLITYIIDGDQVMVNRAMKVEPGPDMNAGVGLGCIFKNRIGVELRYHTTTSPDTERQFEIGFSSLMCNLRYTFK